MRGRCMWALGGVVLMAMAAMAQGPSGNGAGHAKKQTNAERYRARAARAIASGNAGKGRHVGPQLKGSSAAPQALRRDNKVHRAGVKDDRRRDSIEKIDDPHEDRGEPGEHAKEHANRRHGNAYGHDKDSRQDARRQLRQQLADIDALRDAALDSGDVDALQRADALEAELRQRLQRLEHPHDPQELPNGRGPTGEGPPGWLRRGELPPGRDPNRVPPGHDPSRQRPELDGNPLPPGRAPGSLPPGIDPNHLPPGLPRAMQKRFHGRLMHQGTLPPGQRDGASGLPGQLPQPTPPAPLPAPPATVPPSP